jgi:hypothetical protein
VGPTAIVKVLIVPWTVTTPDIGWRLAGGGPPTLTSVPVSVVVRTAVVGDADRPDDDVEHAAMNTKAVVRMTQIRMVIGLLQSLEFPGSAVGKVVLRVLRAPTAPAVTSVRQ